jgi:hypothetical protein
LENGQKEHRVAGHTRIAEADGIDHADDLVLASVDPAIGAKAFADGILARENIDPQKPG